MRYQMRMMWRRAADLLCSALFLSTTDVADYLFFLVVDESLQDTHQIEEHDNPENRPYFGWNNDH